MFDLLLVIAGILVDVHAAKWAVRRWARVEKRCKWPLGIRNTLDKLSSLVGV